MKISIEDLNKVKQVDEPAFLWTRIEARFHQILDEKLTTKQLIASIGALLLIVGLNVFAYKITSQSGNSTLTEKLELEQTNQFY